MDFHLKQWRNRHESEQQQHQPSAKVPKLLLGPYHRQHQQQQQQDPSGYSAVPLFVPETNSKISSNLSAFPDSNTSFTWMGSYFSLAQWQELELQALIYKYMLPGAALIPNSSNKSREVFFFTLRHISSTTHLQHCFHHQPAALLQSGYWGRAAMDPEPGRCRRTDGKKWRCSKDVVAGQSYCERHVHRGHNSSRKPVEMRTSSTTANTVMPDSNATAPHLGSASGAAGVGVVIGCG